MEKPKEFEATQLPEESIQHIQSYLNGKEAARTTLLSKSWYEAWLTRPNLDFSQLKISTSSEFERVTNKTMQRYEELNRKIQSFRLSMNDYDLRNRSCTAEKLIVKAINLGATDLQLVSFGSWSSKSHLPRQVLESQSLARLSLIGYSIDEDQKVCCSRLKSLRLCRVRVDSNIICDIVSKCPLIEELELSSCVESYHNSPHLVLKPGFCVDEFRNLKILSLMWLKIGEWFFGDLSARFPCLKELTLNNCIEFEEVEICCSSLESLVISQHGMGLLKVEFDVPRIRKFKFRTSFVPSLCFKTKSREWESHLSFDCIEVDSSWFIKLREFLLELNSSKIYLNFSIKVSLHEYASHVIGLGKPPTIEKLRFQMEAPFAIQSALLDDLFWCCRPRYVTLCWSPRLVSSLNTFMLICNTLTEGVNENRNTSALRDLEEVNISVPGCSAWTWRSLGMMLQHIRGWTTETRVCLQLKWAPLSLTPPSQCQPPPRASSNPPPIF